MLYKGLEYLRVLVSTGVLEPAPRGYQGMTKGKGPSELLLIEQEKWQDAKLKKKKIFLGSRVCSPPTEKAWGGKGREMEGERRRQALKG